MAMKIICSGNVKAFIMNQNCHVYAIRSNKDGRIYVGMTVNVEERLKEHNCVKCKSTKGFRPWSLLYNEIAGSRIEARTREKYLKSGVRKEFLKSL